jgi:hypothetical protein
MSIFGNGNKNKWYNYLLNFYKYFSKLHNLRYRQKGKDFQVLTRYSISPRPAIEVHTSLLDIMHKVSMDQNFLNLIIHGEIDGFMFENHHKRFTFYIPLSSISGYKKLLHIFRAYGIHIEPKLQFHRDKFGSYVLLNRMYIAKDIFVRYSTDHYDGIEGHPKIKDSTWRSAADSGHPYIYAVSKSYLLNHLYNLDYIKKYIENNSHIITFLTLTNHNGIIVPIPNIILSLLPNNKLKTYNMYQARINEYDLSTHRDLIIDNPEEILKDFLR